MKKVLVSLLLIAAVASCFVSGTVTNENRKISYDIDGTSAFTYAYTFDIISPSTVFLSFFDTDGDEIAISMTRTSSSSPSANEYYVDEDNSQILIGGTGTLRTQYNTSITQLVITRTVEATQESAFPTATSLQSTAIETALDKNTLLIQQVLEEVDRAIRIPLQDPTSISVVLGPASDRVSKALGFDSGGNIALISSTGTFSTTNAFWDDVVIKSPVIDVRAFGADETGVLDSAAAIQLAWDSIKNVGGVLFFPYGTYKCDTALDFRQDAADADTFRYGIIGLQARLDFSASGITTGNLVTIGATSQANASEQGKFLWSGVSIYGPHAVGKPDESTASATSTVGLSVEFALNCVIRNSQFWRCHKGLYATFSFPISVENVDFYNNTVGAHLGNDMTLGVWKNVNFVNNRFGLLMQPDTNTKRVYGQTFISPRFENCWVGCVLDPLDQGSGTAGVSTSQFIGVYAESIDNEVFRMARSVDLNDASDTGNDRDRAVWAITIKGGEWSSGSGWTSGHEPILFPAAQGSDPVVGVTVVQAPFQYSAIGNPENVVALEFQGIKDPVSGLGGSLTGHFFSMDGRIINTLTDAAAPTIRDGSVFLTGGTTTITNLLGSQEGQLVTIIAEHALTITNGTNIFLTDNQNWTMNPRDTLSLITKADLNFYEVGRSMAGTNETVTTGSPTLTIRGTTSIDSSGGAVTATLPDGEAVGSIKIIVMTEATTSSTVSVTNHITSDPEVFTFAQTDDILILIWAGTQWATVFNNGVGT